MDVVVAVDVGGTVIKSAVVDREAQIHARDRRPTGAGQGTTVVFANIVASIRTLLDATEFAVQGVGVVVTGVIDEAAGIAIHSENVGWNNIALQPLLAKAVGLPVGFGHDVRGGALAESRLGAGRPFDDFIFVAIGTGVSAGVVVDRQVVNGRGYAGEIGHVNAGLGTTCGCGGVGCVESVASAAAVARRYSALTGIDVEGSREVAERVIAGEEAATQVWDEAVSALATALSWCAGVVAPQAIVVGGGMAAAGDLLLAPLREQTAEKLNILPCPEIVGAQLGDEAGCLGSALLGWQAVDGAE